MKTALLAAAAADGARPAGTGGGSFTFATRTCSGVDCATTWLSRYRRAMPMGKVPARFGDRRSVIVLD